MRKIAVLISILLISSFFFVSCGASKVTYKKGFPTKDSPALMEFFRYYMTENNGNYLFQKNNEYIYAEINNNTDLNNIKYFSFTDQQLSEHFKPMFQSKNSEKAFWALKHGSDAKNDLKHQINNLEDYDLPEVTLEENNQLTIKTSAGKKSFNLPEMLHKYGMTPTDKLIINVYSVNSNAFEVNIENTKIDDHNGLIGIFMKKDFSDVVVTSTFYKQFTNSVKKGELKEFKKLLYKTELNNRYIILNGGYGVFDKKEKKIHYVEEPHYVSEDGKYVYLNGAKGKLEDGIQRIQKIENYLAGNDAYEAEFKISFKKIAKEAGFKSAAGVKHAHILYFNKDFIILSLSYHAPIVGNAGSTNVIIDLQGDKKNPTAYVVDLDWF